MIVYEICNIDLSEGPERFYNCTYMINGDYNNKTFYEHEITCESFDDDDEIDPNYPSSMIAPYYAYPEDVDVDE